MAVTPGLDSFDAQLDGLEKFVKEFIKRFPDAKEKDAVDAFKALVEKGRNPSTLKRIGTAAMAIPVGVGLLTGGNYVMNKLSEIGNLANLRDPLSEKVIKERLAFVLKRNPELATMDRNLLLDRARMLYSHSEVLFEPSNYEVLEQALLRMKSLGGADYTTIRDLTNLNKDVRAQRHYGASARDLLNMGNNLI